MNFPQRTDAHRLEEMSKRFFSSSLPIEWTSETPEYDYGVDLKVDIFDGNGATSKKLLVQLKASQSAHGKEYEVIDLSVSAYNHLWEKLQVVMLVKYIAEENKAYWLLLSEVPEPPQNQETFRIRIPRSNDLSNIDWDQIKDYVNDVHYDKLRARRRHRFQRQ
ncbi:DUF4365 domain-containing protein [Vibrio lentus]|nr:DUF4365 domain-containing protein [Vibrio lentus]PMH60262.1 hypothetical protein BCU64_19335 [Vibrio lentus]